MSDFNPEENLIKALETRFPGEQVEHLARVLSQALEKGYITYKEMDIPDKEKTELIMFAYSNKLLMPEQGETMAWEDRPPGLNPEEKYRMPNVITKIAEQAQKTGEWRPDEAVLEYLLEIGNEKAAADKKLSLFRDLKRRAAGSKVTPETFKQSINNIDPGIDINQVIAEFKGAGVISPSLHRSMVSLTVEYEINPSL